MTNQEIIDNYFAYQDLVFGEVWNDKEARKYYDIKIAERRLKDAQENLEWWKSR